MALSSVPAALKISDKHDLIILDMPPKSSHRTRKLVKASKVMCIPTTATIDDFVPTVKLSHEPMKGWSRLRTWLKGTAKAEVI